MLRYIQIALGVLLTSFYFFPFEFTFLPGVNTKMAMAGVGLVLLGLQLGKARNQLFSKDMVTISAYALLVSLTSFIAVTLNETRDYTYVSYIISMWVWLSAAYVAVSAMRKIHGYVSVELVCNYLIAVCVFQCVSALLIDFVPAVRNVVHNYILGTREWYYEYERLHGIGALLDPSGSRFAAVLTMIVFLSVRVANSVKRTQILWYLMAFLLIAVVGNMIARTTTVGIILGLAYLLYTTGIHRLKLNKGAGYLISWLGGILLVAIPVLTILYNTNAQFHDNLRFAFEGFFSLAEKGRWEVSSNEVLKSMVVFPDNPHTWLIGDGYFEDPTERDPYYTGRNFFGYYMQTDIGYLRFIFYGGIPCLLAMAAFIWKSGRIGMRKYRDYSMLFWLLLAVNFTVWLKVSTDIFLALALFLVMKQEDNKPNEDLPELPEA